MTPVDYLIKQEVVYGATEVGVADIKAVLIARDAGERISAIERMLGYTRPTVRKYISAAQRLGAERGERARSDLEWETLARGSRRFSRPTERQAWRRPRWRSGAINWDRAWRGRIRRCCTSGCATKRGCG